MSPRVSCAKSVSPTRAVPSVIRTHRWSRLKRTPSGPLVTAVLPCCGGRNRRGARSRRVGGRDPSRAQSPSAQARARVASHRGTRRPCRARTRPGYRCERPRGRRRDRTTRHRGFRRRCSSRRFPCRGRRCWSVVAVSAVSSTSVTGHVPARREARFVEDDGCGCVGDGRSCRADDEVARARADIDAVVVVGGVSENAFVFFVEAVHRTPCERDVPGEHRCVLGQVCVGPGCPFGAAAGAGHGEPPSRAEVAVGSDAVCG